MNPYLAGLGIFYTVEGGANILYWNKSRQPNNRIWQVGRVLRAFGGLALIGLGVLS